MSSNDFLDIEPDSTPFDAQDTALVQASEASSPSGITKKMHGITRLWTEGITDQSQVDRFQEFCAGTAIGLDRLINELAVLRMMLADEAAKPARGSKVDMRGRPKKSSEAVARQFLQESIVEFFGGIDDHDAFLDELEKSYLTNELSEFLVKPVMRYGIMKIQEFLDERDETKYRDPDIIIKLADTITRMEKSRQVIEDQLGKMKVEARVGAIINQILIVLAQKCPDKMVLREVAKGLEAVIKAEDLDIKWESM